MMNIQSVGLELTPTSTKLCILDENGKEQQICNNETTEANRELENRMNAFYTGNGDQAKSTEEQNGFIAEMGKTLLATIKNNVNFTPSEYFIPNIPVNASLKFKNDLKKICKTANMKVRRFLDNATAVMLTDYFHNTDDEEKQYYAMAFNVQENPANSQENWCDIGIYSCEDGIIETRTKLSCNVFVNDVLTFANTLNDFLEGDKLSKRQICQVIVNNYGQDLKSFMLFLNEYFVEPKPTIRQSTGSVATGLALYSAMLNDHNHEKLSNMLVLRCLTLSIGINTVNNKFVPMISAMSVIPTIQCIEVSTVYDNQSDMLINFYEGEKINQFIGQLHVKNISAGPKGVPRVRAKVEINADGLITVSAKNIETDVEVSLVLDEDFSDKFINLNLPSDIIVYRPRKLTDEEIKAAMES